tara:strand:+ start:3882 stop:5600 length:1719 start_codon:yes stop_codon:yes gene_type:complete
LWNQASALDALGVLSENAQLANGLDESRYASLSAAINQIQERLDNQSGAKVDPVENLVPSPTVPKCFDPTPKRLEFALACHLIASQVVKKSSSQTNVIDLGAHRGVFTQMAHEVGSHVWALEPNPELFALLSERFGDEGAITCLPFAVADESGKKELHLIETVGPNLSNLDVTLFSSLKPHPMPPPYEFKATVEVETRTLDSLIKEEAIPADFFLLKIDTEGYEESVLRGLSVSAPEIICLEYWADDLGFQNEDAPPVSSMIEGLIGRGYTHHLNIFQTPATSWQMWEVGFSNPSGSYGNLFFFRDSHHFSIASQWCHQLLDADSATQGSAPRHEPISFGIEDSAILRNLKELGFSPESIYDVGASNGSWTQTCADVFPGASYCLFEPLAEKDQKYRQGLETIRSSGIDAKIFDVVCGIGDMEGSFHQSTYEHGSVGSSSILDGEQENYKAFPTPIRSLGSIQRGESLQTPDLIKMDIQGGELDVLKGSEELLKSCSVLFIETWLSRGYGPATPLLSELIRWLESRNFSLFDFGGQYRMDPPSVLVSQDVVFIRNDSELGELVNRDFYDRKT